MTTPTCKEDVRRFIALAAYLQKFIPNLSNETAPLRELLEEKVAWHWDQKHDNAFIKLKTLVSHTPDLKLYDVKKPVTLQVDACKSGLGAILIQEDRPVAFGSKTLDNTQS